MSRPPKSVAERLRPPMALHAKYVDETSQFRSFVRSGTRYRVDKPTFLGASMRRSRLFAREYLVVQMDDDEFVRQSPGCDAATWDGAFELWGLRPATVLIPFSFRNRRDRQYQSVLEHEYVHVNQALMGRFPRVARDASELIEEFQERVECEYEAQQLASLWQPECPLDDLDDTQSMALRATTQALERMLARAVSIGCAQEHLVTHVLPQLGQATALGLARALAPDHVSQGLGANAPLLGLGAAKVVAEWPTMTGAVAVRTLRAVERWSRAHGAPVRSVDRFFDATEAASSRLLQSTIPR